MHQRASTCISTAHSICFAGLYSGALGSVSVAPVWWAVAEWKWRACRAGTDWGERGGLERAGLERVGRGGRLVAAATHLLPAICYLLPATCYLLPATCSGPSASTGFHPIASRYFHKLLTINKLPQLTLRLGASKNTQRQPCFCKLLIISGSRK